MLIYIIAVGALQEPAATPQAQPPEIIVQGEKAKEKRVVCHTEIPTGSSFSKRVCRTVAQIENNRAQSVKLMDDVSRIQTEQVFTKALRTPR